jgi:dephospho-CoA kinase
MNPGSVKKVVGLTGGIGAGKSVIAMIISDLGIPVFDSDLVAREVLTSNADVVKKITLEFGAGVLTNEELPDRAKLAAIVFNDAEKLRKLNAIIHPTGVYASSFKNILVTCPEELRIQRVIKRNNITADAVRERIRNQMDEQEKIRLADYIIVNDERQAVLPQVWKVLQQIEP